jgi:transcriptional regulator with XRE-family HTH domain
MAHSDANKTLGDIIREARNNLDLSLRDLAKKLDVTPSYLSDIENNRRVPAEDVLRNIGRQLKLDFDELMARAGRFGDDAVRYMMRTPAAGILFRRLAEQDASGTDVEKLIRHTETLAGKKKEPGK